MTCRSESLDRRLVGRLIAGSRSIDGIGARTDALSRVFMDAPYRERPLGGSPLEPEHLSLSLDGFDCVTYVEYALALALARTPEEFIDYVRRMRYADGVVDWRRRNHYMTDWIRRNARAGFVVNRTRGPGLVERRRFLDGVEGLRPRHVRVRALSKREFLRRSSIVASGDLVFFASTRASLDVFHCGIAVVAPGKPAGLRHAARSRGRVVEQTMESFLKSNRMSGVILVRPREED